MLQKLGKEASRSLSCVLPMPLVELGGSLRVAHRRVSQDAPEGGLYPPPAVATDEGPGVGEPQGLQLQRDAQLITIQTI